MEDASAVAVAVEVVVVVEEGNQVVVEVDIL